MPHCEKTEPCVDDVYCNCDCADCRQMLCIRPGCKNCGKPHYVFISESEPISLAVEEKISLPSTTEGEPITLAVASNSGPGEISFSATDKEGKSVEALAFGPASVRLYGREIAPTPENAVEIWQAFSAWLAYATTEAMAYARALEALRLENAQLLAENRRLTGLLEKQG